MGKPFWKGLLPLLGIFACAHPSAEQRAHALDASRAAIAPDAEPALPTDPPKDGKPAFNAEYYLGSKADEDASFEKFTAEIRGIQQEQAREHHQPIQRGFHAKSHGCLSGTLDVAADRDPRTRFGIFAGPLEQYPVVVRFSNGVGWKQEDSALDARGMAVKVLEVPGAKYNADESNTQDFLMTNSPTPVGRDAVEFMKFAHANAKGKVAGIFFLIGHPRTAAPALLKTGPIDSTVTAQYWGGGAFHLGAQQAVKFTSKPCADTPSRKTKHGHGDYLHEDLVDAAAKGICMGFFVQFQVDPDETPIENASKAWDEERSPLVHVADIHLPAQTLETQDACDKLSYSPWHSIAAHKPMGHINRARRFVYEASRVERHGGGEPSQPAQK